MEQHIRLKNNLIKTHFVLLILRQTALWFCRHILQTSKKDFSFHRSFIQMTVKKLSREAKICRSTSSANIRAKIKLLSFQTAICVAFLETTAIKSLTLTLSKKMRLCIPVWLWQRMETSQCYTKARSAKSHSQPTNFQIY